MPEKTIVLQHKSMSQAQCMPMLNMTGTFLSNQILPIKGKWEALKQRRLNVSDLTLAHDNVEMQGNKQASKQLEESQWEEGQGRAKDAILDASNSTGISQDDEMLSWLQYPVDDTFDRNYCTEVYTPTVNCRGAVTTAGTPISNTDMNFRGTVTSGTKPANADKAMALGAERAAGLSSQVGLEAFCKVRTSIQPPVPKWPMCTGATSTITTVTTGEIVTEIQPPKNMSSNIPIYSVSVTPPCLRVEKSSGSYVGDSRNISTVKKESSSCKTKSLENPEPTITSSSGGSENTTEKSEKVQRVAEKRKMVDSLDCQSEDIDGESIDTKKPARPKRSRAAEVHNLSERRRRDRINEKMRALQELIPNSNKTDKASMLDEAIEYLKMLQLQLQMMSMRTGLSLPPVVVSSGIQNMNMPQMATLPYGMGVGHLMGVPGMSVGMSGMGMSMGMGMGMNMASSSSMHSPQQQQQSQQLLDTYNTYVSQQQMQLPLQVVSRDMYNPYMLHMGQQQQQQQQINPQPNPQQQQQNEQHQF